MKRFHHLLASYLVIGLLVIAVIPSPAFSQSGPPEVSNVIYQSDTDELTIQISESASIDETLISQITWNDVGISYTTLAWDPTGQSVSIQVDNATALQIDASTSNTDPMVNLPAALFTDTDSETSPEYSGLSDGDVVNENEVRVVYAQNLWYKSFQVFSEVYQQSRFYYLAAGSKVDIYVQDQYYPSGLDRIKVEEVLDSLETADGIIDKVTDLAGPIPDSDGDSKFTVALLNIPDEYGRGQNDSNDHLYKWGYYDPLNTNEVEHSNNRDMLYIDIDPQNFNSSGQMATGFTAIGNVLAQMILREQSPTQPDWIIMGLAQMAGFNITGELPFYGGPLLRPSGNSLVHHSFSMLSRVDLSHETLFFTYIFEQYGWNAIGAIFSADGVGMEKVRTGLSDTGISENVEDIYTNMVMACYLDGASNSPDSPYQFEHFDLDNSPVTMNLMPLPWDILSGYGLSSPPYLLKNPGQWSFESLVSIGYSLDLQGNPSPKSPLLAPEDTLYTYIDCPDEFRVRMVYLPSTFLVPISDYSMNEAENDPGTKVFRSPVSYITESGDTLKFKDDIAVILQVLIDVRPEASDPVPEKFIVDSKLQEYLPPHDLSLTPVVSSELSHQASLSWKAPVLTTSTTMNNAIAGYTILRKLPHSEYSQIATNINELTYFDNSAPNLDTISYAIVVKYAGGGQSDTSCTATVTFPSNNSLSSVGNTVSNYGSVGDPNQSRPGAQYPVSSDRNYLYDGGLWVGAKVNGEKYVTTYFYSPHTEWFPVDRSESEQQYVLKDTLLAKTVEFTDEIDWPGSDHHPLGIRVIAHYKQFPMYQSALGSASKTSFLLMDYHIINTGLNDDLDSVYVAFWADADVAAPADPTDAAIDDIVDYNNEYQLSYMYDGDNPATPENDANEFGYFGIRLLHSPANEVHAHAWWNWENDPIDHDLEKYEYMDGTHPAMQGHRFMPNPLDLGYPVFDYRILQSVGPISLTANDTTHVAWAMVLGDDLADLEAQSGDAQQLFDSGAIVGVTENKPGAVIQKSALLPNYPNPFNAMTRIRYQIANENPVHVELIIFDLLGRQVKKLVNTNRPSGEYQVSWDATNNLNQEVGSGMYFYQLRVDGKRVQTQKLILLR